ncbi:MAG: right-handed parallel beta-helix repeat-containing protein, partial [Planctomycetes bacterium]|nr:right-handed parallel beta-helix repeat-containing protein [Planctomycetota bacterium]
MFRKTVITALLVVVCCASVASASSPSDYIIPGRALMFDGTLSGLRAAYQTFDDGIKDPGCANCSTNRELRFLRAVTGTATLVIGDDGGSIDSVLELARQFGIGIELMGDYWAPYFDPCDLVYIPLNKHGAYEIPPDAPNANEIRNILDVSMIPDIEAAIADLNSISDTPGDRFRIFLDPNETRIFFDSNALGLQTDVEVDYGEVLILKGLLTGLKGQLEAQSAHDLYIDANDTLAEKVYGNSFNINDDLLDPYPDFLKVLPTSNDPSTDGAALLAQARQDLIDSIDYYLDAIYYICNEDNPPGADPQEDEFIYVDPNAQFDLDIINGLFTDLRNSLEYDTVITYPAQTTKTYDIYDSNAVLIGELVLIYDFCDIEGEDGNLTFTGGNISPTAWEVDWHERDEDWIEVDLENHSGGQWWGGYLEGTLSYDGNNITDATLDYWGPDYGTLNGLSGELVSTVVVDANVNLNPIFSSSPTLSPRDLLPQFDEWNGPLPGTMGHGLGDDPTLGGILPDMNQYDWQLLLDLQPGGLFYLDFISPWQIIVDGDAGDWTPNQPVLADISGDTDEPSDDVNGVDIAELYMAYDWENVYGAITFYDNIGAIFHCYNLYMSYSPDEDWALDTIRLYIEVFEDGSAYGNLYHMNDEYGYLSWDYVDYFEVAVGPSTIEFKIPFTSIPAYLPGRFISIESGGWNSTRYKHDGEDNDTHLRIAGIGSISGTVTYYYPTNALVCVQAYTDPCDPEDSLVASTTITASGPDIPYTLEGIGIGWQGYIRTFTPLHGFNIFDLGAPIVQTSIPVFFMYAGLDGVDLVLSNPTIIVVDDDAPGDPGPGNPNISDPLEDGSTMHPFDSIQEAINAVADGNNVVVLEGTYTGTGNHDLDLLGKAVGLYGLSGPQRCIIDCQQQGRGFHFHSGETEDTLVDGFTIRNGLADKGGGIYFNNSSPTIRNCIITDNSPDAVYLQDSKPIIGGTVEVISDDIAGNGTLQLSTGSILSIAGSQADCNMTGLGT